MGQWVVVVGGANMDVVARTAAPLRPATSNPGHTRISPGGVGRNVAACLGLLGAPVRLVSAVGADAFGDEVLRVTAACGADVGAVRRVPGRTGTYTAVLDDRGELVAAFQHERVHEPPQGGVSSYRRSVALSEPLLEGARQFCRELRWTGPAMFEFKVCPDTGRAVLMEVNGRFWVSLQLAVSAGVDFPRLWVEALRGLPVSGPAEYDDVVLRWLWGDVKRFLGVVISGRPAGYSGPYPTALQAALDLLGPQPEGTIMEMWQPDDRWPALGEWTQALSQALGFLERKIPGRRAREAMPLDHRKV